MDTVEVALLSLILTAGSFGSFRGCYQLWFVRRHRPTRHRIGVDISTEFLALQKNLNISDLLILLFYVLRQLLEKISDESWYGGQFLCKGSHFLSTVGLHLSSNTIVSIAVYRVQCARRLSELNCNSSKSPIVYHLIFVWTFALLASLPQLILWDVSVMESRTRNDTYCTTAYARLINQSDVQWVSSYQIFHSVTISPIPCGCILISYSLVAWMLRQTSNQQPDFHSCVEVLHPSQNEHLRSSTFSPDNRELSTTSIDSAVWRLRSRRATRVMRVSFLLLFVYICCWLPYNIAILWSIVDPQSFIVHSEKLKLTWHFIALSTVLNPWAYRINTKYTRN